MLKQVIEAGPNQYVQVKARKTYYKLQKYGLVLTYEDYLNDQWHLLMPNEVRLSLEKNYNLFAICFLKWPKSRHFRMAWRYMRRLPTYHTVISTCSMHGFAVLEYFKKFFRAIVEGRRNYSNLLPQTIGITPNKY